MKYSWCSRARQGFNRRRKVVSIAVCDWEAQWERRVLFPRLTHWGRVTHICVSKLTIIGSDNALSPGRRQAIIWTNDGILLIWTLGTNFSEISSEIHAVSFKKMHLKRSSAKWRPFCLGLNVLIHTQGPTHTHFLYLTSIPDGSQYLETRLLWHDDVIKWKQFPRYWPLVREIHQSPVDSPRKGQWRGALKFSLICAWINV